MADYFTRVPSPLEVMRRLGVNVPSRKQIGKLFTAAPEFVGPQADVAGMVRDAGQVMPNIRSGDYGQAALNTLAAAAAIPFMALPGTMSQVKGAATKLYRHGKPTGGTAHFTPDPNYPVKPESGPMDEYIFEGKTLNINKKFYKENKELFKGHKNWSDEQTISLDVGTNPKKFEDYAKKRGFDAYQVDLPGFPKEINVVNLSKVKGVTKKITDELPMDTASRMARAKEMGFDVDTPMYHGTRAKNIKGFDDSLIGSVHDSGYYGRGHYFADTSGEAKYYGPNVGEYATNAKLFDLSNETGDATFRGNFKSFAKKLDKIGALDKDQKQALKAINKAEKYVDNNIEYLVGQNPDNTTGIYAKVKNPVSGKYPEEFSVRTGYAGKYPETKKEALENLKDTFIYEMETFYPEQFPGLGTQSASLSDYIRADSTLGSSGLTEKVKEAGFEGIRVGSETVIFDPTKIRSLKAKFDPSKKTSANLLAGAAGGMLFAPAFMDNE